MPRPRVPKVKAAVTAGCEVCAKIRANLTAAASRGDIDSVGTLDVILGRHERQAHAQD
ncbi:hypothetical protein [Streptomyces eurocidicus]|uniref:Uncharacterized protein n=1 Tax=Streptomyces eurocidicus TaxID=66423 RepID=A0A7W8BD26_STREU|nr:hypothetical protein [Streptomyces eurocidicus]MBB5121155.1 hypothetical protein [Streptomyces eurocidicus]MBF6054168.1 hypothetical protein [Streptomyces eurocidicus]